MIAASIVSHGHGKMVSDLMQQLLNYAEITKIIITFNIPEDLISYPKSPKIHYIHNAHPKGYGANHNAAYKWVDEQYFCVLNPDIELLENPFPSLIKSLSLEGVKLVAPLVISKAGEIEDSMRYSPTFKSLIRKFIFGEDGRYLIDFNNAPIYPNWVAGMFMLFDSKNFEKINGFDESFFMYYEDVDICERIWLAGGKVAGDIGSKVIHDARRASRKNLKHMRWHLVSMLRYLWRYR